jgi:hypothetical protein
MPKLDKPQSTKGISVCCLEYSVICRQCFLFLTIEMSVIAGNSICQVLVGHCNRKWFLFPVTLSLSNQAEECVNS